MITFPDVSLENTKTVLSPAGETVASLIIVFPDPSLINPYEPLPIVIFEPASAFIRFPVPFVYTPIASFSPNVITELFVNVTFPFVLSIPLPLSFIINVPLFMTSAPSE